VITDVLNPESGFQDSDNSFGNGGNYLSHN